MGDQLPDARRFAIERHGAQRYGNRPYCVHLEAVEAILRRFGCTDEGLLIAAWLHDTVEDTDTTRDETAARFGPVVAHLVDRVTTPAGASRRERQAAAWTRLRGDTNAIRLKLADRIANVEASLAPGHEAKLQMYRQEHARLRATLHATGDLDDMWAHLDSLVDGQTAPGRVE